MPVPVWQMQPGEVLSVRGGDWSKALHNPAATFSNRVRAPVYSIALPCQGETTMLSALTFGLLPLAAAVALGAERAGRSVWLQAAWLVALACGGVSAPDGDLPRRGYLPGLGELLAVWGPLAFAGLLGWIWRAKRRL